MSTFFVFFTWSILLCKDTFMDDLMEYRIVMVYNSPFEKIDNFWFIIFMGIKI
jgi:hypothetical protein